MLLEQGEIEFFFVNNYFLLFNTISNLFIVDKFM